MVYWRLHYHLIWATHERQPSLTPEREKVLYAVINRKARELDLKIHASGNVDDHIHVVVSIPPKLSVAECVKHIKGASAYEINFMPGHAEKFQWQEGYAALSIGEDSLEAVKQYALQQKRHHKDRTINQVFERISEE